MTSWGRVWRPWRALVAVFCLWRAIRVMRGRVPKMPRDGRPLHATMLCLITAGLTINVAWELAGI